VSSQLEISGKRSCGNFRWGLLGYGAQILLQPFDVFNRDSVTCQKTYTRFGDERKTYDDVHADVHCRASLAPHLLY